MRPNCRSASFQPGHLFFYYPGEKFNFLLNFKISKKTKLADMDKQVDANVDVSSDEEYFNAYEDELQGCDDSQKTNGNGMKLEDFHKAFIGGLDLKTDQA
jgi:hypothetical protein